METKIENLVKALARQAEMVVVLRELVDPLPSISFKRFGLQGMATDISCVHG
jgi:hypothetical protein